MRCPSRRPCFVCGWAEVRPSRTPRSSVVHSLSDPGSSFCGRNLKFSLNMIIAIIHYERAMPPGERGSLSFYLAYGLSTNDIRFEVIPWPIA